MERVGGAQAAGARAVAPVQLLPEAVVGARGERVQLGSQGEAFHGERVDISNDVAVNDTFVNPATELDKKE